MNYLNKLLNIIYPPVCGFCNTINENFLCDNCKAKIDTLKISQIQKFSDNFYYNEHFYVFKYEDEIRKYIIKYKFNDSSYLYKTFSQILITDSTFNKFISKYDCILSVPIHKKRLSSRGYNQSELIAKDIAHLIHKDYYNNVLIKSKNIVAQSTLDKESRMCNVQDAFSINNTNNIINKNAVIFDDIFTTGATVIECANLVKNAGANKIGIITLAKD